MLLSGGGQKGSMRKPLSNSHGGDGTSFNGPPGILAEIQDVERPVIIDTGADINVISKKIVDAQGWTHKKESTTDTITGVNGTEMSVEGTIKLPIEIDGWKAPELTEFIILDTDEFYALIGNEFLRKHGASVSYEKKNPTFTWNANGKRKEVNCGKINKDAQLGWRINRVLMITSKKNKKKKKKGPPQIQKDPILLYGPDDPMFPKWTYNAKYHYPEHCRWRHPEPYTV